MKIALRGLMRNLDKRQEQKPIGDKSGKAELGKTVKHKEKKKSIQVLLAARSTQL